MASLTLVRWIRARPSIVFEALSTLEGLTSWWGPDDVPVVAAEAHIRAGGGFRVRFRTGDGREHECAGEFLDIREPERIVMSWRWIAGGEPEEQGRTSRLELRLRPIHEGTELTLVHAELHNDASMRDVMEQPKRRPRVPAGLTHRLTPPGTQNALCPGWRQATSPAYPKHRTG